MQIINVNQSDADKVPANVQDLIRKLAALVGYEIVIVPDPVPVPTPTPTPTPVPTPAVSGFSIVKDHQDPRPDMYCSSLFNSPQGLFTGLVNHPRNPQGIEIWKDGVKLYSGDQETTAQPIEFGGAVYFPTESDGNLRGLKYLNGSISEVAQLRHSGATVIYRGCPCFASSEIDGEYLIDADSGKRLLKLACPAQIGIPFAACQLPDGSGEAIIALYDGDGKEGLITTTGIFIPLVGCMAVESWPYDGLIAAANGKLYRVDLLAKTVTQCAETMSAMVNHLWYDADNAILWASCSGPDRLLYYTSDGTVHEVAVFPGTDASAFRTRVAKDWWCCGSPATWYRVVPNAAPVPVPPPTPQPVGPQPIRIACGAVCNMPDSDITSENTRSLDGIPEIRYIETNSDKFLLADDGVVHTQKQTDGSWLVWADDFVSKTESTVVYVFDQFRVITDSAAGVHDNPATFTSGQLTGGTMRARWIPHRR